jgi:uncharacterized protein YndB with AHSA1/START domain
MSTKIKNKPATKSARQELIIIRTFDAPRKLVWKAWTDPKHLKQWWGPHGFTNPVCEVDVRPGGGIRIDMRGPDGTVYPMTGVYQEIIEPKRMVFTSGALDAKGKPLFEVLTTVTFAEFAGKTKVTLHASVSSTTAEGAPHLAGMEEGWSQSLDRFAEHVGAKNAPLVIERTFNAPVARVWTALTDNHDLKKWYFALKEFKPVVGFEFQFTAKKDGVRYLHRCIIMKVIPRKKLAYRWRYEGHPGNTLVTFELFAEGKKTRLKLTHAGLETLPKGADFARANFVAGWTMIIGTGLKQFVERKSS